MVPFAGWEMPIQYTSILDESRAVRASSGAFDVSHMGRLDITGSGAADLLDRVLSVDASGLRTGRARYSVICDEAGGIIDDCIVYRRGEERFLLIPNAANTADVITWLNRWTKDVAPLRIHEITESTAMIVVQGPETLAKLSSLSEDPIGEVRPFGFVNSVIAGAECLAARTGYTGEDGFELICDAADAAELWGHLMNSGVSHCGLGARDVLRLEAGLLLHGNDMDTSVNPYEAGLDRFVRPDREGYVAGEALSRIKNEGVARRLIGFKVTGRGIARHGYSITQGDQEIGSVTSGGYSPTLDTSIGLGYVPGDYSAPGTRLFVDVRGRSVEVEVTTLPFYSRRKQE